MDRIEEGKRRLQAALKSDPVMDLYVRHVVAGVLDKALSAQDPAKMGFALWVCGRLGKDFLGDEDLVRSIPRRAVQFPQPEDEGL